MYYAIQICGNPAHKDYNHPVAFMFDDEDGEDIETMSVLRRDSLEAMIDRLKNHPFYKAGWIQIIKID